MRSCACFSPIRLSVAVSWTGLWDPVFPPLFPVNGSLLVTSAFPPSGPDELGSPISQVLCRRYDVPARISGHLWVRSRSPCYPLIRFRRVGGYASGPGLFLFAGGPHPAILTWTRSGPHRFPGDPSRASAPVFDPGRTDGPSPITVPSMLPPPPMRRRLQRLYDFGATARLQHLLPTLHERCCHRPCKARFRLAGSPLPGGS